MIDQDQNSSKPDTILNFRLMPMRELVPSFNLFIFFNRRRVNTFWCHKIQGILERETSYMEFYTFQFFVWERLIIQRKNILLRFKCINLNHVHLENLGRLHSLISSLFFILRVHSVYFLKQNKQNLGLQWALNIAVGKTKENITQHELARPWEAL